MATWTSKNGLWRISKPHRWLVENLKTGWCDIPSLYSGRAYHDSPEVIPRYVKEQLNRMIGEQ